MFLIRLDLFGVTLAFRLLCLDISVRVFGVCGGVRGVSTISADNVFSNSSASDMFALETTFGFFLAFLLPNVLEYQKFGRTDGRILFVLLPFAARALCFASRALGVS